MAQQLTDGHGRRFEYLRLSLTDVCNFRCSYCLPDGYRKQAGLPASLTVRETGRLIAAFARLGLWKVRLTGGEPSLRPELLDIARTVAATPGIRKLAMTTNGYRLSERAHDYADAGISALNISVDSLDPARFAAITGHDRLGQVLDGIAAARQAETVVAVCHGMVINLYLADVLGLHLSGTGAFFYPEYTSIHRILVSRRGQRSLHSVNETAHLRGTELLIGLHRR